MIFNIVSLLQATIFVLLNTFLFSGMLQTCSFVFSAVRPNSLFSLIKDDVIDEIKPPYH